MDQYIGRLLDNRYEILEIIGTGGMAVVYKARCHRLNRLVAIKILKNEFSRDEEFRRRFHAEGEAVAMLSHPNIVQVYDVSSSDKANFIVMELIDGISLKQYMEKKGILNWKETLHFAMQIAKGLDHAHSRGIVHRDIKPHNVMVLKNGSVKVMDFGIARVMSKSNTLTKEALGSVHYISPEQAKGGWVDNRSDLYSLSVVMYEMMAGRPPYDGESPVAVAIQHINGGAPMPSTLNPNIPGGMEQIIMKGMALDVKDRYSSAAEMLKDMDEFRKNPGMLFPFPKPTVSAATQQVSLGNLPRQPRTTAEKVARSKAASSGSRTGESGRVRSATGNIRNTGATGAARTTGTGRAAGTGRNTGTVRTAGSMESGVSRNTVSSRSANAARGGTGRTAVQRRSRQEIEEEEKHSRITTIAIVACSAVAVIGIIIFLIAVMSGAIFNHRTELVEVPDLIGDIYYSEMTVDGFVIDAEQFYNDEYERGQIYYQNPGSGNKVVKGSTIDVKVSLGKEPIEIPDLIGDVYYPGMTVDGFVINAEQLYNDEYERGQIYYQNPGSGNKALKGSTIEVKVSLGKEPQVKYMENLQGQKEADAKAFLAGQGMNPLVLDGGFSDEFAEGEVIRTEPAEGAELTDGQTVKLYVSAGPMIKKAKMPNVVGLDYATAMKRLDDLGFINVERVPVDSDEDKDEVVEQSVVYDTEIDVTAKIVLSVSNGPKETEPPTEATEPPTEATEAPTEATEPPTEATEAPTEATEAGTEATESPAEPTEVTESETESAVVADKADGKTKNVRLSLPEKAEAYELSLLCGGQKIGESRQIQPGTTYVDISLTGTGSMEYKLYINSEYYQTFKVDFA